MVRFVVALQEGRRRLGAGWDAGDFGRRRDTLGAGWGASDLGPEISWEHVGAQCMRVRGLGVLQLAVTPNRTQTVHLPRGFFPQTMVLPPINLSSFLQERLESFVSSRVHPIQITVGPRDSGLVRRGLGAAQPQPQAVGLEP